MANILGMLTVNERAVYEVDGDPSASAGTAAPLSTLAMRSDSGQLWLKNGAPDTAWTQVATVAGNGQIMSGNFLQLPIYTVNPSGNTLDDVVQTGVSNAQNISVGIVAQPTRSAGIAYSIPNPGDAITAASFILSEGAQTKNGNMVFSNNVTVSSLTANAPVRTGTGGLLTTGATSLTAEVSGILPIANGGTNSGTALTNGQIMWSSGGKIVEAGALTNGQFFIGSTGSAPVAATITGTTNRVTVTNSAGGITLSGPQDIAVASSPTFVGMTLSGLTASSIVRTNSSSGLTTGAVNIASADITGVLPIANGGTNSSTALTNGQLMWSSGGKIVEAGALTNGQIFIGSTGSAPVAATITGTTNRVTVTNSAGGITLSGPQDIAITSTPSFAGLTLTALSANKPVRTGAGGILTTGNTVLTSEVTGILPIANGGTNSGTTLNNNRIMVSSGGAIVEAAAMTNGQFLIGATGNAPVVGSLTGTTNQIIVTNGSGTITLSAPQNIHTAATPTFAGMTISTFTQGSVIFAGASGILSQDNPNFFWDAANDRLGLKTATPARVLDVNGSAIIRGPFRIADATATNANYEISQAQVLTTDGSATTMATIATTTDTVMLLEVMVEGRRTGGTAGTAGDSACYSRTARIKNVGGTVTIQTLQTNYTSEDQPAWNATIDVNSTNARIRVTGAINNNISWSATYITQVL